MKQITATITTSTNCYRPAPQEQVFRLIEVLTSNYQSSWISILKGCFRESHSEVGVAVKRSEAAAGQNRKWRIWLLIFISSYHWRLTNVQCTPMQCTISSWYSKQRAFTQSTSVSKHFTIPTKVPFFFTVLKFNMKSEWWAPKWP